MPVSCAVSDPDELFNLKPFKPIKKAKDYDEERRQIILTLLILCTL